LYLREPSLAGASLSANCSQNRWNRDIGTSTSPTSVKIASGDAVNYTVTAFNNLTP
jgi:hypothetical protein